MHPHPSMLCAIAVPQLLAWNPSDKDAGVTLSNANKTMQVTSGSAAPGVRSTAPSGAFYAEVNVDFRKSSSDVSVGVANAGAALTGSALVGGDANAVGYRDSGGVYNSNSVLGTIATYTTGDVIGIAYRPASSKVWFAKNGVWQSGDPNTLTGGFAATSMPYLMAQCANVSPHEGFTIPTTYRFSAPSGFSYV